MYRRSCTVEPKFKRSVRPSNPDQFARKLACQVRGGERPVVKAGLSMLDQFGEGNFVGAEVSSNR